MSKASLEILEAEFRIRSSERRMTTQFRSLDGLFASEKLRLLVYTFIISVISVLIISPLYAQSENNKNEQSWKFSFDQPQTVWRIETDEPNLKTIEHKYSPQEGYGKRGCEYVSLQIPSQAKSIMLGMKVGTGLLSDDVLPTIYVKSNQTGLRFMLRVILPMTPADNSQSSGQGEGKSAPLAILLVGGTYSLNGSWQQIRIDRPLDLLKREAVDISKRSGQNIDVTNAYYDMAYLDIKCGEGELNRWIDDLEINGYVPVSPEEFVRGSLRTINTQNKSNAPAAPAAKINRTNEFSSPGANPDSQTPVVPVNRLKSQIKNNSIYINDSLFFIRAIRYRGEPLEYLRQLGFNTIWMDMVPTEGQMIQAEELGLWLICPPPLNKQQWDVFSEEVNYTPTFWGDRYNRVIAWNLGNLTRNSISVEQTNKLCRRIRECDRDVVRPIIAQADEDMLNYSRQVQGLIIERNPIYSSMDMKKYLRWHRDIPCLIQAGMPRICVIQTQPDVKLTQIWKTMFPNETFPQSIPYEQLQVTAYAAAGSGVRGLFFDSQTSLFSNDPDAQYRSRSLELLNSRLAAADSFFMAGTPSALPVNASDPNLWYIILTVSNKGRLALPLYIPNYAQYALSGSFTRSVSAVFDDIPTTSQAYRLAPNGLEPLKTNSPTGEMNVIIDSQADWSMILFTQNPTVISSMYNRLKNQGKRPSILLYELTANRLENFRPWFNPQRASKEELSLFNSAAKALEYSNRLINQNLLSEADAFSCDAANALRILEYSYWSGIIGTRQEPIFHPAAVSFRMMRLYYSWRQNMQNYKQGDNVLPAGDFESLTDFQDSNWALYVDIASSSYIAAKGDINPMAAYSGKSGLCLTVQTTPELLNSIVLLDKSPITVLSPVVHLEPFELVKITCLVNLPEKKAIKGTVDGLKINDVYSGDVLARRITQTHGWQTIVMFRTADNNGNLQLRFDLTGIGKAYIDNVKIIRIVPGSGGNLIE